MTRKTRSNGGGGEYGFTVFPGFNGQTMQTAVQPLEVWLRWQAGLLKTAAPAVVEWMERRREGTEAVCEALERLTGCEDVASATEVQREWAEGAVKRLEADFRALGGQVFSWPQNIAKSGRSAARTRKEEGAPEREPVRREA